MSESLEGLSGKLSPAKIAPLTPEEYLEAQKLRHEAYEFLTRSSELDVLFRRGFARALKSFPMDEDSGKGIPDPLVTHGALFLLGVYAGWKYALPVGREDKEVK